MIILVTGANGLVGSRVIARLAGAGEKVVGIGRAQLDLRDSARLTALLDDLRPRGIIHCGAMTDVDGCEKDPEAAWAVNARAVEVLARSPARLTALSTDYVFDGEKGDYSEDDLPNPRGVYARSKRAGEEAALRAADHAVCRVAVIYSGHPSSKRTFASSAADTLLRGGQVKAFSDQVVFPEFFADNPDSRVPQYQTPCGIYAEGCGLDKVHLSWGHDEYLYQVVKDYLPAEALAMIRYHSFYAAHREGAYGHLMSDRDRALFAWVRAFNPYDLYSKSAARPDVDSLRPFYRGLIAEYFPPALSW